MLNVQTGECHRLNDEDGFQDAPTWSADGKTLYYVQRQGNEMVLAAANVLTGQVTYIEASRQLAPGRVGYYGQGDWSVLLDYRPLD